MDLPSSIHHLPFTIYEPLLVLVNVHVLRVDDVVVAAGGRAACGRARGGRARRAGLLVAAALGRARRGAALVERLGEFVRGALQVREGVVEPVYAALFESLLRVRDGRLDLRLRRAVELLLVLAEGLVYLEDEAVETVARLH